MVWTSPDSFAQAAGIHVAGVRRQYITREPIAGVSRPQWISEKAGETPAGRGDVESW